ncbi:hypothetical protein Nepgr_018343 [Nepenthes gracilis]|uniref:Filament-like plant protein 4 n=1 Tax=Nepenthes gracilis TaxID=150966 RepID=A0AAD3STW4_NEPGR|nr:hypothetical protein Nepgr_018343 [Nepenthes gracilis]
MFSLFGAAFEVTATQHRISSLQRRHRCSCHPGLCVFSVSQPKMWIIKHARLVLILKKQKHSKMDRRGWPWKKKSSDKSAADKAIATLDTLGVSLASSGSSQCDKDNYRERNYVQVSVESYTHLTGLDDQVKAYEEQVKKYEDQVETLEQRISDLNKKLSAAHSEMTNRDELVKQHAKVAEEAVSGWEKAEAEALALKNHLESMTLSKLTAEDKAAHLDAALKECMWQIQNLEEENERKMQEIVLTKNKQCDKIKLELEAKIANLGQELVRAEADNTSLSRSLQDHHNMLIKINEEKSRAQAEIELLKSNIESCERKINSLKYELHIVVKELEIRNEEKNMSVKSAAMANKQNTEGVRKIAKLEAECQRLRGLVRKKLPGPAALAQMKLEVESLGWDYGETQVRRSPVNPPNPFLSQNPHMLSVSESSLGAVQKFQKENELLTQHLLAMEEETKMLKEAFGKCNSELQASRSIYAKAASKIQSLEGQLQILNQQKGSVKAGIHISTAHSLSQNAINPPSTISLLEDGNDDTGSCADSWGSALLSELSHIKIPNMVRPKNADIVKHLELMDDFLEMEKLAGLSNGSNGAISTTDKMDCKGPETVNHEADANTVSDLSLEKNYDLVPTVNPSNFESLSSNPECNKDLPLAMLLESRISELFESIPNGKDLEKILEEIKQVIREVLRHSLNFVFEENHCPSGASVPIAGSQVTSDKEISLSENSESCLREEQIISCELADAVSQIHNFVLYVGKEAIPVHGMSNDEDELTCTIGQFSASSNKVLSNTASLTDFVLALSDVMAKVSVLSFNFLGYKGNEAEASSPDCIDKVALPENKTPQGERYSNGCSHISDSSSNPEVPQEANIVAGLESASYNCSLEELEKLKAEKDTIERDFARCIEDLETTKFQLKETEELLIEVKSHLSSSQKINNLADTQLKCMAESYKSIEKRAEELEAEVDILHTKVESLNNELQAEKMSHQNALARCNDLEEQLERNKGCAVCSSSAADTFIKSKQEKELASAAEKLAECQETIFLLGKQLKALHPQTHFIESAFGNTSHKDEDLFEEEPPATRMVPQDFDHPHTDTVTSTNLPMDNHGTLFSPPDTEVNSPSKSPVSSNNPGHQPVNLGSSSASHVPTPEKHSLMWR